MEQVLIKLCAYKITVADDLEKSELCTTAVFSQNSGTSALTGIEGGTEKTLGLGLMSAP